jgi:hypothetical protein
MRPPGRLREVFAHLQPLAGIFVPNFPGGWRPDPCFPRRRLVLRMWAPPPVVDALTRLRGRRRLPLPHGPQARTNLSRASGPGPWMPVRHLATDGDVGRHR